MNDPHSVNPRDPNFIAQCNAPLRAALDADYDALGPPAARRGLDIEPIMQAVAASRSRFPPGVSARAARASRAFRAPANRAMCSTNSRIAPSFTR